MNRTKFSKTGAPHTSFDKTSLVIIILLNASAAAADCFSVLSREVGLFFNATYMINICDGEKERITHRLLSHRAIIPPPPNCYFREAVFRTISGWMSSLFLKIHKPLSPPPDLN